MASLCINPSHFSPSTLPIRPPNAPHWRTSFIPQSITSLRSIHGYLKYHRNNKRNNLKIYAGQAQNKIVLDGEEVKEEIELGEEEDAGSTGGSKEINATSITDEVMNSVKLLKAAAKTRKVPSSEVISALEVLKNAKLDPSTFLNILGGTQSPGRTWMLIFTAQGRSRKGYYFPITAVQRFDASAARIENGVYLGPIGCLTFEGRFSWKKRILAFIFESLNVKIGPVGPLKIGLGKEQDKGRTPGTKDPFFIWFYVDEEIAVAQGRGGGTAFWCRCTRVT
eukprot:Gb_12397 [translate_table: standard]